MRATAFLTAGFLALVPLRTEAQVQATIVIGGYPIGGVVRINEPPARRVVVIEREAPRVIVVEQYRGHKHGRACRHARYHTRTIYYDYRRHAYYDRYRPGLTEVVVVEHDGRYYTREDRGRRRG